MGISFKLTQSTATSKQQEHDDVCQDVPIDGSRQL